MTTEQAVLGALSALYGLLLSALSWAWRRTIGEQDRIRKDLEALNERTTRQEERTSRLMEIEQALNAKLDRMLTELGDIRERLARWEAAQQARS